MKDDLEAQASVGDEEYLEALARQTRRRRVVAWLLGVVLGIPLLAVAAVFVADVVYPGAGQYARGVLRGELNILGQYKYSPAHAVSAEEFARAVDVEAVHAELLPNWLVARSYDGDAPPSARTSEAFQQLQDAVRADLNLAEIVTQFGLTIQGGALWEEANRVRYLAWAWNDYLRQQQQPYYFETVLMARPDGAMAYVKNYRVAEQVTFSLLKSADAKDADNADLLQSVDALLAHRVDDTNVVENYLCRATDAAHRPLWVIDTAARDAAQLVWPMLAAQNDDSLGPVSRAFAPAIRNEASQMLSAQARTLLEETAPVRHQLLQVVDAVNARTCNDFSISYTPLLGYESDRLENLWRLVSRRDDDPCPKLTAAELETLIDASDTLLARQTALLEALGELSAWVARPHLVHEARHFFDATRPFAEFVPRMCTRCTPALDPAATRELRAYLAAVAYSDAPVVATFLGCRVAAETQTFHRLALAPFARQLTGSEDCSAASISEDSPAVTLREAARAAQVEWMGSEDPIRPDSPWPTSLDFRTR